MTLANEGVVEAYGHLSIRHPHRPERYLLACSRSPELVDRANIMEFTLDGSPVSHDSRALLRLASGCTSTRCEDFQLASGVLCPAYTARRQWSSRPWLRSSAAFIAARLTRWAIGCSGAVDVAALGY